ncbi:MAG TPA: hypothetical protein VN327_06215 [Pseudonocardiaceae bacterium]|jgi:hypothetical protein|nr:hypothetical protein [Pseudonocardiaceae bacterium]
MIHSLDSGAVRLPEDQAIGMAKAILHLVSTRVGARGSLRPQGD